MIMIFHPEKISERIYKAVYMVILYVIYIFQKALAASLNLRTTLYLERTDDSHVTIDLPDIGLKKSWSLEDLQQIHQFPLCMYEYL